jgi:serine/threonine protein kinase
VNSAAGAAGEDPIADSAERYLALCLQAPEDQRQAALEEACRQRPDLAQGLRAAFAVLQGLGLAGDGGWIAWPEQLGDFRLGERLGGGGMGVVFRARQLSLARDVALKMLRPDQLQFASARERFRREAAAIAALEHPGIVPILAVGEERGVPWFAMPLLAGKTLAEALSALSEHSRDSLSGASLAAVLGGDPRSAPLFELDWNDACVEIARQVALALEHAHQRGIRHRDIKPSNIVLGDDGRARVVDFGLAARDELDGLTKTGSQLGTLYYMAPEQVRGDRAVGPLADVYALGVTLHECLTLTPAFAGDTRRGIEEHILRGERRSLRECTPGVDRDLECVVAMACELEPARRYSSAAAFAEDLRCILERRPVAARPPGAWLRARRWVQREPALAVSVLAAVLVFGVAPSVLLWRETQFGADLADSLAKEEDTSTRLRETLGREREARAAADLALEESRLTAQLMDEILSAANPSLARGRDILLIDLLEPAAAKLRTDQAPPRAAAKLLSTIAGTQDAFEKHEAALANFQRGVELEQRNGEVFGAYAGQLRNGAATSLSNLDRLDESEAEARSALAEHELACKTPAELPCTSRSVIRITLGVGLLRQGRFEEAAEQLSLCYEDQSKMLPADAQSWAIAGVYLSDTLRQLAMRNPGRDSSTRWSEHVRGLAERRAQVLDSDDPATFQIAHQAARVYSVMNRHEQTFELLEEAREGARRVFGPESHWVTFYEEELGGIAYRARDWERSEAAFQRALELHRKSTGPQSEQAKRCEATLSELARRRAAQESAVGKPPSDSR